MCKINGHNLFTYLAQPYNMKKLYTDNERNKRVKAAKKVATQQINESSKGEEVSNTASIAQINQSKKNQTLSSLRVPLDQSVGTSLGGTTSVGLNLGG